MSVRKIATRYAKSLLDLALEKGEVETVRKDMHLFRETMDNRDFRLLVQSPIVHSDKKRKIFEILFKGRVSVLTFTFLKIMTAKGRERYLADIVDRFDELYNVAKGIMEAQFAAAVKVDNKLMEAVKKALEASFNKKVVLHPEVREALIGGFVLNFDHYLYDASVSHRLRKMKKQLLLRKN